MNFQRLEQYGDKMEKLAEQLREKLGKQEVGLLLLTGL